MAGVGDGVSGTGIVTGSLIYLRFILRGVQFLDTPFCYRFERMSDECFAGYPVSVKSPIQPVNDSFQIPRYVR